MVQVFLPLDISQPAPLPADAQLIECHGSSMGTHWQVSCYANPDLLPAQLHQALQQRLDQLEASFSHWRHDSELAGFNLAPAGSAVELSEELATVLDYAIYLARQTGGAYDPAAGQLVNRWGFGPPPYHPEPPLEQELQALLALPRWSDLEWQFSSRLLRQPGALWLDLSSIAKGYAVDQLARLMDQLAIPSYLIDIGGELRGCGIKPNQQPWWIELELPPDFAPDRQTPCYRIAAHHLAVASSGNYRQQFVFQGRQYGHTLDPRNGQPLQNDLLSVSVIADQCMKADALATALLVMGSKLALEYAGDHRIAALLMCSDSHAQRTLLSPQMRAMLD